jgi:hypothetical protein
MDEVAELLAAERVVTHILDHAAAIRVGVGLAQLVFRSIRKTLQQQGLEVVHPQQIDDLFMG